ncbi:MAG: hypothetical protein R2836_05005 [Chitinophagales bacterium]|nr:hypothetical protein [Bacteroidota bacterium]MCB9226827.1 hypothetical protein [Chitinophagales bacterium]
MDKEQLKKQDDDLKDFKPKGAMAFFVLLLMLLTGLWLFVYFVTLTRIQ